MIVFPRVPLVAFGFAALACCTSCAHAGGASGSSEPGASEPLLRILWSETNPQLAHFLPQRVLESQPLSELPLSDWGTRSLEGAITLELHPQIEPLLGRNLPRDCEPSPSALIGGADRDAKDIPDEVLEGEVSVLATVEEVVPGWEVTLAKPHGAAYAVVDTVVRDTTRTLHIGSRVVFLRLGANIAMQGASLCQEPASDFQYPEHGIRFLVNGNLSKVNEGLLYAHTAFPVEGSRILLQPFPWVRDSREWTIDELLAEVAERTAK